MLYHGQFYVVWGITPRAFAIIQPTNTNLSVFLLGNKIDSVKGVVVPGNDSSTKEMGVRG